MSTKEDQELDAKMATERKKLDIARLELENIRTRISIKQAEEELKKLCQPTQS